MQPRLNNTDTRGRYFSEQQKLAVWQKAAAIADRNPAEWRQDPCGARIRWSAFGTTEHQGVGWEIDHIVPVAHNGTDDLINLQALQWENNREKGDGPNNNYCKIVARV